MLAVFVGGEAIVGIEAMLVGQIGRGGVLARAPLGVRAILVVWPEAVDDEALARTDGAFRRRRLLAVEIAETGRPRERHHVIVERRGRDRRWGRSGLSRRSER